MKHNMNEILSTKHESFRNKVLSEFMASHQKSPVLSTQLTGGHLKYVLDRTRPQLDNLYNKLKNSSEGGSASFGGSYHMGGGFSDHDVPETPEGMYKFSLHLSPYQVESMREAASQLLGGKPSPFHPTMADGSEELQADPQDYENIVRMPNAHAMGRMIEAEHGYARGGGFFDAFKHVARTAGKAYRFASSALGFATKNKDTLMNFVPDSYKGMVSGALDTAASIDAAINPMIEATIDAVQENASQEQKNKLKVLAEQSIDKAVQEHLPGAKPYYDTAKETAKIYNTQGLQGVAQAASQQVQNSVKKKWKRDLPNALSTEEAVTGL